MIATNAAGIALQTQAVITLINNKGDISKTLKDMASSDTIRNMATAALTAGLTANLNIPNMTNSNFANELIQGVVKGTSNAAIESTIGGTSFQDALRNNLINAFVDIGATQVAGQIGGLDFSDSKFVDGLSRSIVHGMAGCIAGQVTSKDCGSRAMGAALGEAIGTYMAESKRQYIVNDNNEIISFVPDADQAFILNTTKMITASVAALYGLDVNDAAQGSDIAVTNNALKKKSVGWDKPTGSNGQTNNSLPPLPDWIVDATAGFGDGVYAAITFGAGDLEQVRKLLGSGGTVNQNSGYYITSNVTGEIYVALIPVGAGTQALSSVKSAKIAGVVRSCFVAGTLIETIDGLKAIENIKQGDLIWSRHEETLEYGYRPVVNTGSFDNKDIYEVIVRDDYGKLETYQTTEEHPFWVADTGWLPASLLQIGMTLVNRDDEAILTVVSQGKLDKTDTVYNFEVAEFHTYHIGEFGTWVHNADCLLGKVDDLWATGSPTQDALANLNKHFVKHKAKVGADDIEQYMRKAEAFKQNLKGATKSSISGFNEGVTRYSKNGKYIDLTLDGKIVSFGSTK